MASVAAENGDNIKSTCYHYITCRNSNFIINVKKWSAGKLILPMKIN